MLTKLKCLRLNQLAQQIQVKQFSTTGRQRALIETEELAQLINQKPKNLRILNGTWYPPGGQKSALGEHKQSHIPTSIFFDINGIANKEAKIAHMHPNAQDFTEAMKKMRVRRTDHIVCYDDTGIFTSSRVAFTMKYFGAENVQVLSGGMKKWLSEGRKTEQGDDNYSMFEADGEYNYKVQDSSRLISNAKDIHKLLEVAAKTGKVTQIVDGRPPQRFKGEADEAPGLRKGHISGSLNVSFIQPRIPYLQVFFQSLINQENGTLKSDEELAKIFKAQGVDIESKTVTSCATGMSACVVALALEILGNRNVSLYEGSWRQYGAEPEPQFNKQ